MIPSSSSTIDGKAKPKADAKTIMDLHPLVHQMITQQEILVQRQLFSNRTYEGQQCYFLVFKPFNKSYLKDPDWYRIKGIDAIRKSINSSAYFITREIKAAKVHINMLCYDTRDLSKLDGKNRLNRYRVFSTKINSKTERDKVLNYITKESTDRQFTKYLDYLIKL